MDNKNILNNQYDQSLDFTLHQIEKQYGKCAIMRLGQTCQYECSSVISSGSFSLDIAMGGGFPRSRIVEIFGSESSGKTTLALHVIANAQKNGGYAAVIDAEHAFDPLYAKRLGVNLDRLLLSQPECAEDALEICELLLHSNAVDVIVIDSVAALVSRDELDSGFGSNTIGLQAKLMSQALRKLAAIIKKTTTCIVFINQLRMKIGKMYGSIETTPGGRALKFHAAIRLKMKQIGSVYAMGQVVGYRVNVNVVKNKLANPFHPCEFDILFDSGIFYTGEIFDYALFIGVVKKTDSWYIYNHISLGQNREQSVAFLDKNTDIKRELDSLLRHVTGSTNIFVNYKGE